MATFRENFEERLSVSLLADSAFRAGVTIGLPPPGLVPLDPASRLVGPAVTVDANNDLVAILDAVHRATRGDVVVITNRSSDVGLIGDVIGSEAVRKGIAGFVVDGLVRDTTELINLGITVFCRGAYPVGPLKVPPDDRGIGIVGGPVSVGGARVGPGS